MAKQRLGKGLQALIPSDQLEGSSGGAQPHLRVSLIDPNPFQPRQAFGDEEMADLISSIDANGLLQPLTIRESENGRYELVAGERRLRAAKALGLEEVPVYILSVDSDVNMMEYALIENIQREDLNPMEQAEAFALLHGKYDLKQEEIAQQVGMSRSAVANYLRILRLPSEIKTSLRNNEISMGHARALLGLPQPALIQSLWKKIVQTGMSVRQTEAAVHALIEPKEKKSTKAAAKSKQEPPKPAFINEVEVELLNLLSTKVRVKPKGDDTGAIEIFYYSQEDLERILDILFGDQGKEKSG